MSSDPASFRPIATLLQRSGFLGDTRFAAGGTVASSSDHDEVTVAESASDLYAQGRVEGYAAALAEAQVEIARRSAVDAAERQAMRLAMTRIDAALETRLAERLHETVSALCEATLAPLALDPEAVAVRVTRAAAMLARAEDERVIRLHPDDVVLLAGRIDDELTLCPDASLARGAVRVEGAAGGVEDGPEQWRAAIAAALAADAPEANRLPHAARLELVEGPRCFVAGHQARKQEPSFDNLGMHGA